MTGYLIESLIGIAALLAGCGLLYAAGELGRLAARRWRGHKRRRELRKRFAAVDWSRPPIVLAEPVFVPREDCRWCSDPACDDTGSCRCEPACGKSYCMARPADVPGTERH